MARAIMTHASVPAEQRKVLGIGDTFVRLSVGIENVEDLIADLDQAMQAAVSGEDNFRRSIQRWYTLFRFSLGYCFCSLSAHCA